ncbi:uncharacterized protein CELE_C15C8.8 [Caenorhabditis elegans]|uniref:Secreted protein n=1 Tax=Caenorhabditis elegans TaxID=6239 RepID=A5Z2T3_CAEEL|nr:Secreted protein [Caenorhabditis elegans]CAN99673.1 Secreted protein [Caenorhabditis elegans]|eukprot:NP_001122850.1 Uncharacterized protein CELE_C15C8.8 [Caenorhabditis elegans]
MISLTSIVILFFTEAVVPVEKKPRRMNAAAASPKLSTCQWVFGNGTIASMPKKWTPVYALSSQSSTSSSSQTSS